MIWAIKCKVEGGLTGKQEALLKNQGELVTFTSEPLAANYAKILTIAANSVFTTAKFTYQPIETMP